MQPITPPVTVESPRAVVVALQDALRALLTAGEFDIGPDDRLAYLREVESERGEYGYTTDKVVGIAQSQYGVEVSGRVDERTAELLNELLRRHGLLTGEPAEPLVVAGQVTRDDGTGIGGLTVAVVAAEGAAVRLGQDTTGVDGRYTARCDPAAALLVSVVDARGAVLVTSEVRRRSAGLVVVDLVVPYAVDAPRDRVRGNVVLAHGAPAEGVELRLYRIGFGGKATQVGSGRTGESGRYSLDVPPGVGGLELRAVEPGGAQVVLTRPMHGRGAAPLVVVAPTRVQPPAPEHRRLAAGLAPHVGDLAALAGAREDDGRQDLTLLTRATGWDARLLALAANAASLARTTALPHEALYGMLRAGLPADPLQLARVSAPAVRAALTTARDAGVIGLTDAAITSATGTFTAYARATGLALRAPGSRSTYGDMLATAPLDASAKAAFATAFLDHRGDAEGLWDAVARAGVGPDQVRLLRRQGKLAFLTANSAQLTGRLQQLLGAAEPDALVGKQFYEPQPWLAELRALSGGDPQRLAALVPTAYTGADATARAEAYAADLARKVRVGYPTQVLADRVTRDDGTRFRLGPARAEVATLLGRASGLGFRLGRSSVQAFLTEHPAAAAGLSAPEAAKEGLRTLHRVYQLTPSDEALPVLLEHGLTSAFDIVALSEADFISRFGAFFPDGQAHLVYRKAQQVSSVTYTLFTAARTLDATAAVPVVAAATEVHQAARDDLVKQFPTLRSLFGSQDHGECEHCRSVLSPGAYLVDLLRFVDVEAPLWRNFLATWRERHNGVDYPGPHPYDVLTARRPDLPHLLLTCENTETELPHIDLVTEVLEYHVAHGALAADAVRDTGSATTEELLAEPQHVLAEAYTALDAARYPVGLPFDLWLATARAFCGSTGTPLWTVLDVLRPTAALVDAGADYDGSAVLAEELGLSPTEVAVLTDPEPLDTWFTLFGHTSAAQALTPATAADTGERVDLRSAACLARRLGVTYRDLLDLVRCGWINPELPTLVLLRALGATPTDVLAYRADLPFYTANRDLVGVDPGALTPAQRDRYLALSAAQRERLAAVADLETRLAAITAAHPGFDARAWLTTALADGTFDDVLVLADTDSDDSFETATVRYADGRPADPVVYLRLTLFVRLRRTLGWTTDELDRALVAFTPADTPFDAAHLAQRPLRGVLVLLAHLDRLHGLLGVPRTDLLVLWDDLATTGRSSPYARLFLTRSVLRADPAFDDPLGRYLRDLPAAERPVAAHRPALQSALGATADDLDRVLRRTHPDAAPDISLAVVSDLRRHTLLAKALGMPVRDLLALIRLSGTDPFRPLGPGPLAEDPPPAETLRLVELARALSSSGLTVADLDYLLRHETADHPADHTDRAATLATLRTISDGIRAVHADHPLPDATTPITTARLGAELGLAFAPSVVDRFLGLLEGTSGTTVSVPATPADQLDPVAFAGTAVTDLHYDQTRQQQRATVRGVLTDEQRAALVAAHPGPALPALLDAARAEARAFFDATLRKQRLRLDDEAGFLDDADFATLFAPVIPDTDLGARRHRVAEAFLPVLRRRLVRALVVQTVTGRTTADPALVTDLLTDERLISTPGALLGDLSAVGDLGFSTTHRATSEDPWLPGPDLPDVDTSGAVDVRFDGYLEVPAPGPYRFTATLDTAGASVRLTFPDRADPVLLATTATAAGQEHSAYLELEAATAHRFTAEVIGGGHVQVQGESLPRGGLDRLAPRPAAALDRAADALLLLDKALAVTTGLALSRREVRHLLTHRAEFSLDLSRLPVRAHPDNTALATELFTGIARALDYTRLRQEVAGGGDGLVDVFAAATPADAHAALAALTRRPTEVVTDAVAALPAAPLTDERSVRRVWELLRVVERLGVPVAAARSWTRIIDPTATPAERAALAADLTAAVKSRYDTETWLSASRAVVDPLRQRRRDALVAHVRHTGGFTSTEQLYEHFLVDPGAEPVVRTSRVRLAISSVQLFVQRCLLNLEPRVHPSVFEADKWEAVKRYRVWEANRKIFLYPENWLEPEFRDDKTPPFRELESALLQADVSADAAEDAFLGYLRSLEEIARLDVVATHLDAAPDPADNTLHVIARGFGQSGKYHHRTYRHRTWSAWEPISAEVTGEHLAPVVWRDRLHLFWVTFVDRMPTPDPPPPPPPPALGAVKAVASPYSEVTIARDTTELANMTMDHLSGSARSTMPDKVVVVQLHWSELAHGQWSTHTSAAFDDGIAVSVHPTFDPATVPVHVAVSYADGAETGVSIHLGGAVNQSFHLAGRNSAPQVRPYAAPPANPYSAGAVRATRRVGSGPLTVRFQQRISTDDSGKSTVVTATPAVLRQGRDHQLVLCDNDITLGDPEIASLVKPVFYQDDRATFFLEPSLDERTVDDWQEWVTRTPAPVDQLEEPDWWKTVVLTPVIPKPGLSLDPDWAAWPPPIDQDSLLGLGSGQDWLVNARTGVLFGGEVIGPVGRTGITATAAATARSTAALVVPVAGSGVTAEQVLVAGSAAALRPEGLAAVTDGISVVGASGLTAGLKLAHTALGAAEPGGTA
ncbi:neuraminidase-like domain-containing protein [Actinokineospora bangkokensis]|uniref:Uncharacterized protein n=1 Tax=Actinokineospora bangkokensis TaxID=1193682 RepID=A0A1Q9LP92_9PSEU|nr:neuraminidase-like domain-containing protein [Actinokineospora bangkokensis]OLR93852.1 hypothetical protein BJP25_16655 [Actinokineospora bangkokensis]